jgi:hypothetical protein
MTLFVMLTKGLFDIVLILETLQFGVSRRNMRIDRIGSRAGKLPVHFGQIGFKRELVRRLNSPNARKP